MTFRLLKFSIYGPKNKSKKYLFCYYFYKRENSKSTATNKTKFKLSKLSFCFIITAL